jgi:hypothetical protein
MNWRKEAENDLRNHQRRIDALDNSREKIKALKDQMVAVKAGMSDSTPVIGGGNRAQENMVNCIAECERLEYTMKATEKLVDIVDKGLATLTPEERRVLELFYINRVRGHVEQLMEEMHLESSQIYRIKDAALYKFTTSIYGIIDY